MISSSYTFNTRKDDSKRVERFLQVTGCTEYPAHNFAYTNHAIIMLPLFSATSCFQPMHKDMVDTFGKDYTRKQYMTDYTNMIMEIFKPINDRAGKDLFELYTMGMYKADLASMTNPNYKPIISDAGFEAQSISELYSTPLIAMSDSDVIGIKTNCNDIRIACGARSQATSGSEHCRKVQLAHTAMRLIYSSGYHIAMLALKIYKETAIHPFYCMWLAYKLRNSVTRANSDYGDWFTGDAGFVSYETFVNRFFDPKLNQYVMKHFDSEQSEFAEYFGDNITNLTDSKLRSDVVTPKASMTAVFEALNTQKVKEGLINTVSEQLSMLNMKAEKIKFSFNKKLFTSVVSGKATYNGTCIPNSKLGRVIFKDDNEVVLSVLKTSQYIKIIYMKFLLGSDPEAFIVNDESGLVVSSKRFTYGTKDEPEWLGGGFALLNDNILIEGNVPPAPNKELFIECMTALWNSMNERAETRGAHLHNSDCETISDALMETDEAKEFGCSSFRDAWNENVEIATPQLNGNYRPAGCHIHIGIDSASDSLKMAVVRAFDMFVTLPAIEITGMNYRTSNLYGILGACRIKSYGVEARSLGGTFFSPKYFGWIYDNVEKAINFAVENEELLVNLPSITTYIGEDRIAIAKEYKKLLLNE